MAGFVLRQAVAVARPRQQQSVYQQQGNNANTASNGITVHCNLNHYTSCLLIVRHCRPTDLVFVVRLVPAASEASSKGVTTNRKQYDDVDDN